MLHAGHRHGIWAAEFIQEQIRRQGVAAANPRNTPRVDRRGNDAYDARMIRYTSRVARRSFVSRFAAAAAAAGGVFGLTAPGAAQTAHGDARWQPLRHAQDDWLDDTPGKHRIVFDTTTVENLADAIRFAGNFFTGNKAGYGLEDADVAILIGMRHLAASFGFNDAIWAKHGETLATRARLTEGKGSQTPTANPHTADFTRLASRGVRFALCNLSTRSIAGLIADRTGGKQDDAYAEITANLVVRSARLVPAGIVAMSRAQERGYTKG